ncbi:MAG: hypothetical protein EOM08_09705 [Clostridia bacterium]|nr:hypothetical protein [Clostridia bacterium]
MKPTSIIYQSNAGHTRRYAELFAQLSGLPVYDLRMARSTLQKGEMVIFFGWLMAGNLQGLKKAARRYRVGAMCAVGMGCPGDGQIETIARKYGYDLEKAFYLQGGLDFEKLHGLYGFMMKTLSKFMGPALEKKDGKSSK